MYVADDAMGDEDDEEESDAIVTQVLDELGLQLTDQLTAVPAAADNSLSVAAGAAAKGKAGAVQNFLRRGMKVDTVDSLHRSTPLHWAAGAGKVNTMEMLIARGATVDARSESDATPLHQAVLRDRPEAVKLLLNNNANVNLKNKSGYTPLDYATANKRTEITQLLKSAGALSGKAL